MQLAPTADANIPKPQPEWPTREDDKEWCILCANTLLAATSKDDARKKLQLLRDDETKKIGPKHVAHAFDMFCTKLKDKRPAVKEMVDRFNGMVEIASLKDENEPKDTAKEEHKELKTILELKELRDFLSASETKMSRMVNQRNALGSINNNNNKLYLGSIIALVCVLCSIYA